MSNEFTFGHENGWNESNLTISSTPISTFTFRTQERNIIDKLNDNEKLYRYGGKIKDVSDKELIEEFIYLIQNALKIQQEYEMYVISHKDELKKYKKLFGGNKNLLRNSYTIAPSEFIVGTDVFESINDELINRGYKDYADVLWDRYF